MVTCSTVQVYKNGNSKTVILIKVYNHANYLQKLKLLIFWRRNLTFYIRNFTNFLIKHYRS